MVIPDERPVDTLAYTFSTRVDGRYDAPPARSHTGAWDLVLGEVAAAMFSELPRANQRQRGLDYLRGLLYAQGRKSIRNIASAVGGRTAEQRLHHFISSSTWDWVPVRRRLAEYVAGATTPAAWVIRPVIIPKSGEKSIGVERSFHPTAGQMLNAQRAFGVWAASQETVCPINWWLHLPRVWLEDAERRDQASIPPWVGVETIGDCAARSVLEVINGWGLPTRPCVMDARDIDAVAVASRFLRSGSPILLRISSVLRLEVPVSGQPPGDPPGGTWPPDGVTALPAHQIMRGATGAWSPGATVVAGDELSGGEIVTVRVRLPADGTAEPPVGAGQELVLIGVVPRGLSWPTELWLTNVTAPPAELFRLSRLIHRVDQDIDEVADRVGMRDFTGRSFAGWHRHATLASAAHTIIAVCQPSTVQARPALVG